MPPRSDSRSRARTRPGIRTTRRRSPCYRHPDEPITGICASCLRERLSGLDSSGTTSVASPQLRRCRSVVSSSRCEASSSSLNEPRRKSCDVVSARNPLSTLFDVDDLKTGSESEAKVESKNVGLARVTYTVIESERKDEGEIGVPVGKLDELNVDCVDGDAEVEDGEFKTMKEYIDLEFQSKAKKSKDLREIAGNLLGAASVFTKKLRKWRQKNSKTKEHDNSSNGKGVVSDDGNRKLFKDGQKQGGESLPEFGGRRSCDTEPRLSVDAGRISFEEPRASWDGYMIARTIPRLTPMLSVVENGILGNVNRFENRRLSMDGPMHSIVEDESSSAASGSGQSNSDSSSSMRQSSFDRSSSVRSFGKKVVGSEEDRGVSPANVKLVITEKELKDWHMSSSRDDDLEKFGSISKNASAIDGVGNLNGPEKKSIRWRGVRNLFGFRVKNTDNVSETTAGNEIDPFIDGSNDQQGKGAGGHLGDGGWKLTRNNSGGSRNSYDVRGSCPGRRSVDNVGGYCVKGRENFKLERNRSAKYSPAYLDNGITPPFYMTPLRSLKNSKSGKFKLQSSPSAAGHVLQLN